MAAHEELIVRNKDFTDNATPSGNSVAADVMLKLSKITGNERYERYATKVLALIASQARRYPQGFGRALAAMEFAIAPVKEIVLVNDTKVDLANEVWSQYLPSKVVVNLNEDLKRDDLPLLEGRTSINGGPTAYVCESFVCSRPVTTAEELSEELM